MGGEAPTLSPGRSPPKPEGLKILLRRAVPGLPMPLIELRRAKEDPAARER